jgi:formylglycine-generating enzyme required for sulfatase activity
VAILLLPLGAVGCQSSLPEPLNFPSRVNSIGMKMVHLPGGDFEMGHPEFRKPVHKVKVSSFWISEAEVTNEQYEALMPGYKRLPESMEDDMPAIGMSRGDAVTFAQRLSKKESKEYRLPTDAEWEYAARGGLAGKDHPWGNHASSKLMNTGAQGYPKKAVTVKSFPPNAFGLYDMVGNAGEWILDTDLDFPPEVAGRTLQDPLFAKDKKGWLTRGGSFMDWYPFVWAVSPMPVSSDRSLFFDCGIRLAMVDSRRAPRSNE